MNLPAAGDNSGSNQNQTQTGTLNITVNDGTNAIVGASVVIDGTTKTTDDNGLATFTDMEYKDYSATISATGFVTVSDLIRKTLQ